MKNSLIINEDGTKVWYKNGLLHRVDGPTVEDVYGTKYWYFEGKRHRVDGPALEFNNGDKVWYYQGQQINCKTPQEFEKLIRLIKLRVFW